MTSSERFLRFSLGHEEYAVPLQRVREVIALPEITPIPRAPAAFVGVINLRGQVITVADMRTRLNIKALNGPETAVVICEAGSVLIGLMVDSINAVISPKEGELGERPELRNQKNMDYVTGVWRHERGIVLLVDIEKLFRLEGGALVARAS